ncbi:MAG: DUF4157 domain-containing protein [Bacteroidetes bacterium]|nr:DUF4157 domain-containing protein [Bacteroidota bacterium]
MQAVQTQAKQTGSHTVRNAAAENQPALHNDLSGVKTNGLNHHQPATFSYSGVQLYAGKGILQTKPLISKPGDVFEQEADNVAEKAVRGSAVEEKHSGNTNENGLAGSIQSKQMNGAATSGIEAPGIVQDVLSTQGTPLDKGTKGRMESTFGSGFSDVRIHTNTKAAAAAASVQAKAFTSGQDIVFGKEEYNPGTVEGDKLIAHELTHTLQQQQVSDTPLQRDTIDDAREKLSYGLFDWAITDSEALDVLAMLSAIPAADLPKELARLGTKYVTRFLDNLPDAAKTGDIYKRVIEAIGPAGLMSFADEQLSYGLFDWAITDNEATRVFNTFVNLPTASHEDFFAQLYKTERLGRLIDNATGAHHIMHIRPWMQTLTQGALTAQQRDILRVIVENSDNLETTTLATKLRFNMDVGPSKLTDFPAEAWHLDSLKRTYLVLDKLPDAHTLNNAQLIRLGQFNQPPEEIKNPDGSVASTSTTGGAYNSGLLELGINVESTKDPVDDIIHETGHSVDAQLGWSKSPEPAKPERGGWKSYGADMKTCAEDMIADSNGGVKTLLTADQQKEVVDKMKTAMLLQSTATLMEDVKALSWFPALKAPEKRKVTEDKVFTAMEIGLKSPWFDATDGGEHLGDHVYEESYKRDWSRYRHEARTRMIKPYQFRKAGEWFAVCYAAYYKPDKRGKGAQLNDKDPDTKKYFDEVVDKLLKSR